MIKARNGVDTAPAAFDSRVEAEYVPWVLDEVKILRGKAGIIRWAELVDSTIDPKIK